MTGRRKVILAALATVGAAFGVAAWWSLVTAGAGNLGPGPVDALVVFGSPADITGAILPMQAWRVDEAVAEYRRGVASHLIMTGGAAANRFVEADVMARRAEAMGVPADAISTERSSLTTIENLRGVSAIMAKHGWTTAELISSPDHLPRIAVIARPAAFRWRLHPAATPGRGTLAKALAYAEEASATLLLRTFGSAAEPLIHTLAICEHVLVYLPKWVLWKLQHHSGTQ